ncbi:MAG: starch-binding protein [Muribaculaceae bacterium]|nr:starch-binding protein [Muribaculaceae bacterium]
MLKKLFIYMTLLLTLSACSVDDLDAPCGLDADGVLTVDLAVPEMETVVTRADEFKVSDITMLVLCNSEVKEAADIMKFSLSDPELNATKPGELYQIKCTLSPKQRKYSNLKFIFIANLPSSVNTANFIGKTETQLKSSVKTSNYVNGSNCLTMAGSLNLSQLRQDSKVNLARNIAKVTVTNGSKDAQGNWTPGSITYPFEVYGASRSSSVISGTMSSSTEYIDNPVAVSSVPFSGKSEVYVHRTSNPGRKIATRPFMIVKAPYNGKDYFYRLEFENYDEKTKNFTILDILSNHHYQVIIEDVLGRGDEKPEDAMNNPTSLLKAIIYDYCPESFNMITDGTRELGVSAELVHNGNPTTSANPEYLYVKIYSEDGKELENPSIKVSSDCSWLSIGVPVLYNGANGTAIPGVTGDYKGKVYRIPVQFLKTLDPGEMNGKIRVTWLGLQREVPVKWTRAFDATELCTVQLTIKDNNGTTKYTSGYSKGNDYWTFIKNTVKGLTPEQNNGKIRNEGLHFPVNYGGQSARWQYVYKVKFNNLNDGNNFDWEVSTEGIKGITISPAKSGKNVSGPVEITITQDGTVANWDYEVGKLLFKISKPNANNYTTFDIDLYHTGFFDNPRAFRNENRRVDISEPNQYYYYEVIEGPAGAYYWLDRNLGATSAEYYIEADGGMSYFGNSEARGGYYRAAKYVNGGDPEMYSDLCPPGFEIPRTEVWNTLRNNSKFLTSKSGTYYLTQFTNNKGQTVYFPRSMYYNSSNSKIGESRAGYYWTQTAANGLEKDQIGNWLRYIKFSGSIASYDNAEVQGRYSSNGWAMSVRCVNKTVSATKTWRTHFNVSGATHVFLYSETKSTDSNGNPVTIRNGVTNWPGTSIGNYSTMGNAAGTASGTQLFNFVYESPNTNPTEFYVIFTFRDINGIWHTMSKGDNGATLYSTNRKMSDLKGWKVIGDTWNGKTTALGGTWICNFTGSTATVTYGDPTYTPPVVDPLPENLTVYYTNPSNWTTVYVYAWNSDSDKNAAWPGVKMTKSGNQWVGTINKKYKNVIFNNGSGGSGNQTPDLKVEQENNHVYTSGSK